MRKIKGKYLLVICFSMLFIGISGMLGEAIAQDTQNLVQGDIRLCELTIKGMTCIDCANKVKKSVKDFVLSSKVSHAKGTGIFVYADGKTTCDDLAKKVNQTGFKATVVQ